MKPWNLALALALAGCAANPAQTGPQAAEGARVLLPSGVVPVDYAIEIAPDAAKLAFTGRVQVVLKIASPTRAITFNAAELDIRHAEVSGAGAGTVSYDVEQQTATVTLAQDVPAGEATLTLDYAGKIQEHAAGLFALDYESRNGQGRALYTQFENSDARRFVPCWDEPALKATFSLTATVPAAQMAVSNMPVESSQALGGGLKRVRFARSPQMSSYLLFFALGDFERVSRRVNGVDIGVVVKRGDLAKTAWALDAAAQLLPYYEDYFGLKYPLPKLDLVAGPGASQFFGAMENWGAIFYFENALLIDAKRSTQADRRDVYEVVAHEMAHQWFGNLVTMAWWDDLWLNEGFADWMEAKATGHFHPDWKEWLIALGSKERAMKADARRGTHPVIQPVTNVLQANQAFDPITYSKGKSVIRMVEDYVGAEAFRASLRRYMREHAYGNTVTDDFWRALDAESKADVAQIAHDFTLQAGVPLVRVAPSAQGVVLAQGRYAVDESGETPARWHIPVSVRSAKLAAGEPAWRGVVTADAPVAVPGKDLIVNAGQAGYFRTLYEGGTLDPLAEAFRTLDVADQIGLVNDAAALGNAGYAPLTSLLQLVERSDPALDPMLLSAVIRSLAQLEELHRGLPQRAQFVAFGVKVLKPIAGRLGWSRRKGEAPNETLLRAEVLKTLGAFDDAATIARARELFAQWLKRPAALSGDTRETVLHIVAQHADAAAWDALHEKARSTNDTVDQGLFYALLGDARDPVLAQKALALSLTDELPVTQRPRLIESVSGYYPVEAFDFAAAHWPQVERLLEPDSRSQFVPDLISNAHDRAAIGRLRAFAQAHIPDGARRPAVKAEASIAYNATIREERLPGMWPWLDRK